MTACKDREQTNRHSTADLGATGTASTEQHRATAKALDLAKLSIGALGVVYGDIGTSPLYAFKECVSGAHGVPPTHDNVLGLLSLLVWALILVVVIKYLVFVLSADNNGEGGVLSLMALVSPSTRTATGRRRSRTLLVFMGLFGAAMLCGEGMITPPLTVLSAIEGLSVATTAFNWLVVPITCGILIGLFLMQKRGTARIGSIFGPIMLLWFGCIGAAGLPAIIEHPEVLAAISPWYGVKFFMHHGLHGFLVLGAVVLCITGVEALYADMGHFGRKAIRLAWFAVVFPGVLLNYFGQGAILLARPESAANPFFALAEGWLYPMVAIATAASIIASQALISGAFSLTRQAIQLGYSPRMTIVHTSGKTMGQIYIPEMNSILMIACLALVLAFRTSSNLTAAYGIAVTATMAITSVLFYFFARQRFGWPPLAAGALVTVFLVIDLSFFSANIAKLTHGGWFPLAIALAGFTIMTTWKKGRMLLAARFATHTLPLKAFVDDLKVSKPHRVSGTAVFMTSTSRGTPNALMHHFKHNKVIHEQVVIVTITTDDVPEVPARTRVHHKDYGNGIYAVTAHYGFMEMPNMPRILNLCRKAGIPIRDEDTSFYLGRETLLPRRRPSMSRWRRDLFIFLSRNARTPSSFFGIPPNRVVEMGTQIEI
ncbi:MAG: potassium transporter Kup [Myxococcota bacterium]|jgi:KUP system potassium uptake protein|nr:potassium transporter Kup [Myxococcota bacterium]